MKLPRWLQWRSSQELDEEIQAHLDLETRAGIERGLPRDEARFAALRQMGNVTRLKERAHERDPLFWLEATAKDIRYALRSLRRNPGFTAAAALSLALGIGVNGAIFSFADGLLLRPLDVPHPNELVDVHTSSPRFASGSLSYREYAAYRDQSRTLSGLAAERFQNFALQVRDDEQARICFGHFVSGNYFSVLEVRPLLGRSFLPEEDSPAAKDIVALLSYQSWQTRFRGDPHVTGRRIKLNGQPVTIVGVLPSQFTGTNSFLRTEVYVPIWAAERLLGSNKHLADLAINNLIVYGRLKPGVNIRSAQAEFAVLARGIEQAGSEEERSHTAFVLPQTTDRRQQDGDDLRLIYVLLSIAAIVLLVGCLNVANLLLGRASARVREIAVRQSVGASRGRLIAQLLTESAVLVGLGACGGLLLAEWAVRFFTSIQVSPDFPTEFPVRLDGRVVLYSLTAAIAAVLVSGLWPAIRATRIDLASPVKGGAPPVSGRFFRGRNALVAVQAALATMLLASASLFVKSFILTSQASPGFRVEDVLILSFDPALAGFSGSQAQSVYRELEERVSKLPGVRSAALGSHIPMGSNSQWDPIVPEGEDGSSQISVMFSRVEPGYFATLAVPILAGRSFDDGDRADAPGVVVVNQALAQRFWPKGNAVGQRLRWFGDGPTAQVLQVVGVAGNGKYQASTDKFEPYFYLPDRKYPRPQMTLFVNTIGDPAAMAPTVRAAVKAVAPNLPVYDVHTMKEIFEQHGLLPARVMAQMVGAMGAIGLTLGLLGLYAVSAFAVTRRTREIGIRMALGATVASVLTDVLALGLKITLAGIAIGLAGAFFLTRYVAEFLDRVGPRDPLAFAGVPAILLVTALAACWAPARRASMIDPAVTLRYE